MLWQVRSGKTYNSSRRRFCSHTSCLFDRGNHTQSPEWDTQAWAYVLPVTVLHVSYPANHLELRQWKLRKTHRCLHWTWGLGQNWGTDAGWGGTATIVKVSFENQKQKEPLAWVRQNSFPYHLGATVLCSVTFWFFKGCSLFMSALGKENQLGKSH